MDQTSPDMTEIMSAVSILHGGQTSQARALLLDLWERLSGEGDAMQICTLAHFLADTETEVASELEWDMRAFGGGHRQPGN